MTRRPLTRALAAVMLAASLGGCVAAAIPLAAGGVLVGRDKDTEAPDTPPELARPPFEGPAAASPPAGEIAAEDLPEPAPSPTPATAELAPEQGEEEDPVRLAARSDNPPPRALRPDEAIPESARGAPGSSVHGNPYDAFYAHAIAQAQRDPVDTPRKSAMLASPGSLEPVMADCSIRPPAVLIDLDPEGGMFTAGTGPARNPELAQILVALRVQEVEVHWISDASAADAGTIRKRLLETGLDPWGRDPLLLMRRPEDRKQVLRRELSGTHCIVAIAADTRGDFDELFDYLRDPAAAAPLDALIGDGWFLTPLPLTDEEG